ncbi:complex I subunit 4 family protein [Fundidesulfovibrio soli]|uniref:complex I subunit 4 family protein n=1 Tax=Fundidesulfovibrio soli TaxID=2922716 RepID=UPI001FAEAEB2|nr:NADH-quinone oxidoreductase subunit M [Fundidesulfovibrio soli]
MNAFPWLSLITFLPLGSGLLILGVRERPELCRKLGLAAALAELAVVLAAVAAAGQAGGSWLLVEDRAWIPGFAIRYTLAMDGLSQVFVCLTALFGVLGVLVSWRQVTERVGAFHFCLLAALSGVQGVFLATDLILFALFWEAQLIPVFFLIAVWGHGERRRAAVKFFLFSATGGLFMFLAVIVLSVAHAGGQSFALADLTGAQLPPGLGAWLFAAFLLSFAVKIPLVPIHIWLPDAHTQAPTAGSLILAGLLLKTGGYALMRFAFPLFPAQAAACAPLLVALGLAGVFFASLMALVQDDLKRLVAYSSIAHMGLTVAGIASLTGLGMTGAVVLMVCHALTTGGLFASAGMVDERLATRSLKSLGGLWDQAPLFGSLFLVFSLASAALPGLGNFVGEIMIVFGLFKVHALAGAAAVAGMAVTLIYLLRMNRDTLFGPRRSELPMTDVGLREALVLVPLALAVLLVGLHPAPLQDLIAGPIHNLLIHLPQFPALGVRP